MCKDEQADMPLITKVVPLEGKRLRLTLYTGSELVLNMENRLNTMRFYPLNDDDIFHSVTTDGFYLHFDTTPNYALDFTLREALRMAVYAPGTPCPDTEQPDDLHDNHGIQQTQRRKT